MVRSGGRSGDQYESKDKRSDPHGVTVPTAITCFTIYECLPALLINVCCDRVSEPGTSSLYVLLGYCGPGRRERVESFDVGRRDFALKQHLEAAIEGGAHWDQRDEIGRSDAVPLLHRQDILESVIGARRSRDGYPGSLLSSLVQSTNIDHVFRHCCSRSLALIVTAPDPVGVTLTLIHTSDTSWCCGQQRGAPSRI